MDELLKQVSKRTGIEICKRDAERVIGAILSTGDFWSCLPYSDQPFNAAAEIVRYLHDKKFIEFEGSKIYWQEKGKKWLDNNKIQEIKISTCSKCKGRTFELHSFMGLLKDFKRLTKGRPKAVVQYDQGYVTPETTVLRVAMLAQRGDIQSKEILILGDDDLVSIAAGISGFPSRVVVVEIDERIVSFIRSIAEKNDFPIEVINLDIRKPLPAGVLKSFDTFLTDPPETLQALELFISRGVAGLKGPGCAGYFGLTYSESSKLKWRKFQEILSGKLKVVVTDMITNFNEYVNWGYLLDTIRNDIEPLTVEPSLNWYRSTQYRIETLKDTPVFNRPAGGKEIYVDKDALLYSGHSGREEK